MTTFAEIAASEAREPVWILDFADRGFGMCSRDVEAATKDRFQLIDEDGIQIGGTYIDIREGRTSIGEASVTLSDLGRQVSDLAALCGGLGGAQTTIKLGFVGIPESAYVTLHRGTVARLGLLPNHIGYSMTCSDALAQVDRQVFLTATPTSPVTLTGNPIEILLRILTSTGTGTNGAYDTLAATNGLGIIVGTWIDTAGILAQMASWLPNVQCSFTIVQSESAFEFIATELMKPFGCHLLIDTDGKITVRFVPSVVLPDTTTVIDHTSILDPIGCEINIDEIGVNRVVVKWDYNSTTEQYATVVVVEDLELQGWYGRVVTMEIASRGLTTALGAATHAASIADRIFRTFGMLQPPCDLRCNLLQLQTAIGSTVLGTSPTVSRVMQGVRQVISGNVDPRYFLVEPRMAGHAAAGTPDYGSQTDAQKLAGWSICSAATGKMSNGDPGYNIAMPQCYGGVTIVDTDTGLANLPVQITKKEIDLNSGSIVLSGVGVLEDPSVRYGRIAAAGAPEFTAATATQKATNWWIASATTGRMSDATRGYGVVS